MLACDPFQLSDRTWLGKCQLFTWGEGRRMETFLVRDLPTILALLWWEMMKKFSCKLILSWAPFVYLLKSVQEVCSLSDFQDRCWAECSWVAVGHLRFCSKTEWFYLWSLKNFFFYHLESFLIKFWWQILVIVSHFLRHYLICFCIYYFLLNANQSAMLQPTCSM